MHDRESPNKILCHVLDIYTGTTESMIRQPVSDKVASAE